MSTTVRQGHDDLVEQVRSEMPSSRSTRSRSSYSRTPKRNSMRVEKTRTPKASPRINDERRRTFTGAHPYPTLADHYRAMYGASSNEPILTTDLTPASRPLSWHPSSAHSGYTYNYSPLSRAAPTTYLHTDHSVLQDQIVHSPYEEYLPYSSELSQPARSSWYSGSDGYVVTPGLDHNKWSCYSGTSTTYSPEASAYYSGYSQQMTYFPPMYTTPQSSTLYNQATVTQSTTTITTSSSSSYDMPTIYTPLARIETAKDLEEEHVACEPSQELIGMGLYDEPGATPILSGLTTGNTLKLEESWQPPEAMVSDDEEETEEEEVSPMDKHEPLVVPQIVDAATTKPPQLPALDLSERSFLFEEHDDTIAASQWWYHQQQQPKRYVAPAAAYSYGLF